MPDEANTALTEGKNKAYRVWRGIEPKARAEKLLEVITRVVNDEKTADIAKDLGISRSALNMALLEYCEEDWRRAQIARALTRTEKAQDLREKMENGEIPADIALLTLARDSEKSAQWQLERLLNRLFGQKQDVGSGSQVQINIGIRRNDAVQPLQSNVQDNVIDVSVVSDK
jgi:DNA-binding MarR family transcriptional regulator